ncbi:YidB family protein [Methyloceanibacter sp.]|uniref:YidB family protein n=1 Tax=Methyloceanibacter sp. TaxID=1965321 RepID=UPI003D6CE7C0
MASSSNIFGSDGGSAVPGGNVAKPLVIALLALLASRYFSKKGSDQTASAEPQPAPRIPQADPADASPGDILDGLGGLVKQFQQKGLGDTIDSWVNRGKNEDISSRQMSDALGSDVVDQLSRRTGLSRDEVISELAKMLPNVVDRMTPDGRLPTQRELARLLG